MPKSLAFVVRNVLMCLDDHQLYCPATILRWSTQNGLLTELRFSKKEPARQDLLDQFQRRLQDSAAFPRNGDGLIRRIDRKPQPGWFGYRWKRRYQNNMGVRGVLRYAALSRVESSQMFPLPSRHTTSSPEETFQLGVRLAANVQAGDVIMLNGPLGAGKTLFTRGFCSGLGMTELYEVDSPTYSVVNHYDVGPGVDHLDLYRFEDIEELDEIGIDDILNAPTIKLIEWPRDLVQPRGRSLSVTIDVVDEHQRMLQFTQETGASP